MVPGPANDLVLNNACRHSGLGQDEMQVTELVPEVPLNEGGVVRVGEQFAPDHGLEHQQVRRDRLVPARQHAVDGAHAAFG